MSNPPKLRDQLAQLKELSSGLADRLEADAQRLEETGIPLEQTLLDDLGTMRLQLEDVAKSLDMDHADPLTLAAVTAVLDDREGFTDAYRAIDQLLALRTLTPDTGLEELQLEAEILREEIAAHQFDQAAFNQLVQGTHPWCALQRLVTQGDSLQDAEWDELSGQVREHLGSALATAALRGKIHGSDNAVPATNTPNSATADLGALASPVVSLKPADSQTSPASSTSPSTDNIFDEDVQSDDVLEPTARADADPMEQVDAGAIHSVSNSALFEDNEPEAVEPEQFDLAEHQRFINADGPLGEAARDAIRGDRFVRGEKLSRVVQLLILEGRSGLACHLSNTMEAAAYPFTRNFPSWMVRAWTLGHAAMFQRGQLASMLSSEFAKATTLESEGQLKLAQELFARAVTLRPSIVTPSTGAPGILRSFPMDPETTQIFNFCSRVSKLGEQIQGLLPGQFRKEGIADNRTERLLALQEDVKTWKHELQDRSFRYEPTKPLFMHANWTLRAGTAQRYPAELLELRQWQDTVIRAHRITEPILNDDREQVADIRAELERLSSLLRDAEENATGSKVIHSEEMRTYLRRAMSFGQRWLAMHVNVADGEGFVSQAAVELKTEVEERYDGVVQEVQELMNRHNCFEIDVAGACFLLALEQVQQLFSPDAVVPDQEPDPRHLIHAELLKMPELKLTSQWEPIGEASMLEDTILEFLARPQPDWLTAFQLQINQGNIDYAERIVGLGTCTAQERSQLKAMLNQHVKAQRDQLWAELEETEAHINEAVKRQRLSELQHEEFVDRVERVRAGLSSGHEFTAERDELYGLRHQLKEFHSIDFEQNADSEQSTGFDQSAETTTDAVHEGNPAGGWVMDFSDGE